MISVTVTKMLIRMVHTYTLAEGIMISVRYTLAEGIMISVRHYIVYILIILYYNNFCIL